MPQAAFEQDPSKKKSSAESHEAKGVIGLPSPEQMAAMRSELAQKEAQRDALLTSYRQEFAKCVKNRDERDAAMILLENQRMSGVSKMTEAQMEVFRAGDKQSNEEEMRYASRFKQDAIELENEIEALKRKIEEGSN